MVLLRNEKSTLPLSKAKTTVAIGPMAEVTGTLIGNYFGQICPDSYDKNGKETFDCVQTLAAALNATSTAQVTTVPGLTSVLSNNTAGFAAAITAAKAADQVVLYLGIDGSVEGEGKDRHFVGLHADCLGQSHLVSMPHQTGGGGPDQWGAACDRLALAERAGHH
eukprot:SAG11_NODE_930_length_6500_cov_4.853304_8_plen_165_part_00